MPRSSSRSTIRGNPDAIYVYDPVLVGSQGAVLLRPGKEGRRGEPSAIAESLADADVPIAAELAEPVIAEGGDTVWLDEETLLVGIGYRTSPAAVPALADAFPGVDVVAFDLPHWNGRGEVMHLMSLHLTARPRPRARLPADRAGAAPRAAR